MTSTSSEVTYQDVQGRIDQFMTKFKIATLLNLSGMREVRGISPACVVRGFFQLAFVGRNIYPGVHTSGTALMGKDAVYRLLSSPRSNWRVLCNFRAISPRNYRMHYEGGSEAHQASLSRQVRKLRSHYKSSPQLYLSILSKTDCVMSFFSFM